MARRATFEEELQALSPVAADPHAPDAAARLGAGLASKRSLVVARAARLVREHAVDGHGAALADAFTRFLVDPVKSDPSCQAKLAALEALEGGAQERRRVDRLGVVAAANERADLAAIVAERFDVQA